MFVILVFGIWSDKMSHLNIKEASEFATKILNKNVTESNISYLSLPQ